MSPRASWLAAGALEPLRGLAAGSAATLGMSVLMLAGRRLGVLGRMPPEKITAGVLDRLGIERGRRQQDVSAFALHVGFGAAAGALFDPIYRSLRLPVSPVLQGAVFSTGIWALSYLGWVPALGIMPPPRRDRPGRPQVMLAAHWVYGGLLGWLCSRQPPRSARLRPPAAAPGAA